MAFCHGKVFMFYTFILTDILTSPDNGVNLALNRLIL